jgi:hypothetical protein
MHDASVRPGAPQGFPLHTSNTEQQFDMVNPAPPGDCQHTHWDYPAMQ